MDAFAFRKSLYFNDLQCFIGNIDNSNYHFPWRDKGPGCPLRFAEEDSGWARLLL
jgi:hypothetical protein